jgi:hypothetical protein
VKTHFRGGGNVLATMKVEIPGGGNVPANLNAENLGNIKGITSALVNLFFYFYVKLKFSTTYEKVTDVLFIDADGCARC